MPFHGELATTAEKVSRVIPLCWVRDGLPSYLILTLHHCHNNALMAHGTSLVLHSWELPDGRFARCASSEPGTSQMSNDATHSAWSTNPNDCQPPFLQASLLVAMANT